MARALLAHGARLDLWAPPCLMSPQPAQFPLAQACRGGHKDVAKLLLDKGADKDQTNGIGWTALHEACYHDRAGCVQLLLVYGADLVAADLHGHVLL